jgi:hypothetical protein
MVLISYLGNKGLLELLELLEQKTCIAYDDHHVRESQGMNTRAAPNHTPGGPQRH